MTAPNHVAGGFVITGVFCSLWNINIVASPFYLISTIFFSLLPDIDYTKTILGQIFRPLSRFIYIRFGHRTITHSALYLFSLTLFSYFFEKLFFNSFGFTLIVFFASFSHILLDMLTISGVALFYPFYKNPCVIPGNANYRIRTGDLRAEGLILFFFVFLGLSLQNLFANGFWTSYNQNFNDIEHIHREAKRHKNLTKVKFDYFDFENQISGVGFVAHSTDKTLHIIDNFGSFHSLEKGKTGLKIETLTPSKTDTSSYSKSIKIIDKNLIKINQILAHKYIYKLNIFTNSRASILYQNNIKNGQSFTEENIFNPHFSTPILDSLKANSEGNRADKIRELEIMIKAEEDALYRANSRYYNSLGEINRLSAIAKNSKDAYTVNDAKTKIIDLQRYTGTFVPVISKTLEKLKHQLETLKNDPLNNRNIKEDLLFNGEIVYFDIKKQMDL